MIIHISLPAAAAHSSGTHNNNKFHQDDDDEMCMMEDFVLFGVFFCAHANKR